MAVAKSKGIISHRWFGRDGECFSVDEWPDAESFQSLFEEAGPQIGPVMGATGVTSAPEVTEWYGVALGDAVGRDS